MSKRDWLKHLGFITTAAIAVSKIETMGKSNEPTILEMNRVICEFMGGKVMDDFTVWGYTKIEIPEWAFQNSDFDTLRVGGYAYHTSWDWLMPVCKKIRNRKHSGFDSIMASMKASQEMNNGLVSLDLERTHKGVYQFITWHNQQAGADESLSLDLEYRGQKSHCKACEDEANGIKHIKAAKHTCRKRRSNEQ